MRRTARVTGLWYLALGVIGGTGFLLIRPMLHVEDDPAATLSNLVDRVSLARLGVILELGLVLAQALAAVWFYKLFRPLNPIAAWAVAVFGMVNAIAVATSAVFLATALSVATQPGLAPSGDAAATVQLLYELSSNAWGVGNLFFGLWLIPMGHVIMSSGRMPRWLGVILIIGGVGYLVSGLVGYGFPSAPTWLVDGLVYPATIAEFWMIGYLLLIGIRPASN